MNDYIPTGIIKSGEMKIDALVFDLDGTAVPLKPDGMPSQKVIDVVNKAKKVCHVSIATGRPLGICEDILNALDIQELCILNGGSHLYSRQDKEFVWKQEIDELVLKELFHKLRKFKQYEVDDEKLLDPRPLLEYLEEKITEPVALPCIFSTTREDADEIVRIARSFKSLTAHSMNSYKAGTFDVHITHELATKKHALRSLLARMNVDHDNVMVVGDGGNDLPLFELAGWKVAMGNADEELKAQADWVAPSVAEDGLVVAIEKFILN